jgi:alpha-beta hydrolase superfamily lysophospholipase
VYFLDRRGSGLNGQDRGDAPGFRRLLDDITEFLITLRNPERPVIPIALVAISWGGKLAVAHEKRHPGLVDGIALLCPGFFARVKPSLRQRLAILRARLLAPQRRFAIPLNAPELFTANRRWQRFIAEDELSLREASARLMIESVRLDGYLRFVPRHVRVPVLLMLAELDRIIDNDRTRRYVERFKSPNKEVIEYPKAHHTLEFEREPDFFIDDLLRWLDTVVGQAVKR